MSSPPDTSSSLSSLGPLSGAEGEDWAVDVATVSFSVVVVLDVCLFPGTVLEFAFSYKRRTRV